MSKPDPGARIASLDLLRGLVIVLMALDHSRAFVGAYGDPLALATTTPAWFFTRWITHFCAPVFVALAGMGAALWARKVGVERASGFLLSRGLWLIFLEITVVNTCWQLGYNHLSLLVIWALGASMLALGLLVRLHRWAPLIFGLLVVLGHNMVSDIPAAGLGSLAVPWGLTLSTHVFELGGLRVGVSYPFLPWAGLMALGWAVAPWLVGEAGVRSRRAVALGGGLLLGFLALRGLNLYGEPTPWAPCERGPLFTFLGTLACTKYPPSLQYLLMTLGPPLLLLPLLERWRGRVADVVHVFGRVPMFFYLLHIPVIHIGARLFTLITQGPGGRLDPSLLRVWACWALTIGLLYPLCVAWGKLKATRRWWWLRYL